MIQKQLPARGEYTIEMNLMKTIDGAFDREQVSRLSDFRAASEHSYGGTLHGGTLRCTPPAQAGRAPLAQAGRSKFTVLQIYVILVSQSI